MTFAVEVHFLTGRYVATAHHDRDATEWPPHPARLFSAMVAAWGEAGEDADERAALEWLEAQPAPSLRAGRAHARDVVTHFVPGNDVSIHRTSDTDSPYGRIVRALAHAREATSQAKRERAQATVAVQRDRGEPMVDVGKTPPDRAEELLGTRRNRQPRTYPSVTPDDPRVTLLWPTAPHAEERDALDALLSRVTRLGHSSSLVSCRVVAAAPDPDWVPADGGDHRVRVVGPGQLAALERRFEQHKGNGPRALPSVDQRYRGPGDSATPVELRVARSRLSGDMYVWEVASRPKPDARRVRHLTAAFRAAVLSHFGEPSELLSGHARDGGTSRKPHVAYIALPFVGHRQATGAVMGMAAVLPSDGPLVDHEIDLLKAIGRWDAAAGGAPLLTLGRRGTVDLARVTNPDLHKASLQAQRWSRPSTRWVTATPIALPRHPGDLARGSAKARERAFRQAEKAVVATCAHVGLPAPADIDVSLAPLLTGTAPAKAYGPFRQGDNVRALVHARVRWRAPVGGPLLLGSGRYLGLGLMFPEAGGAAGGRP